MALGQPIDYTLKQQNPLANYMQGLQARQAIEQQKVAALQAQKDEELKAAQGKALQELVNNQNATAQDYARVASMFPKEQAEGIRKNWEMISTEKQQGMLNFGGQVMAALTSQNPDIAKDLLEKRVEAERNSGNEMMAKNYETMLKIVNANPELARASIGQMLAATPGGQEILDGFLKEKKYGLEYEKLMDEKEKNKLRALEAELRRTDSELKRQELQLKINDLKEKAVTRGKEREAEAGGAIETFDRTIGTLEKILNHPGLSSATGLSSFMAYVPGTEARDVKALIDTFESQAFTAEVQKMKGLGALSEAEGKKLSSAVANLDRGQTEESFKENLTNALSIFKDARDRAKAKYSDVDNKEEDQPTGQTIEPGTVEEGYRFKGGNPADPNSWEKV